MICHDCERPARMAVRVTRPQRENVIVAVFTDDRATKVPAKASRYCCRCGLAAVAELLRVLVDVDGDDT